MDDYVCQAQPSCVYNIPSLFVSCDFSLIPSGFSDIHSNSIHPPPGYIGLTGGIWRGATNSYLRTNFATKSFATKHHVKILSRLMLPGEVKLTRLVPGEVILLVFWCYRRLIDWLITFLAGSMFCCLCDAGVPWAYESAYQCNAWQPMPKLLCLLFWPLNVTRVSEKQRWAIRRLQLPIWDTGQWI